MDDQDRLLVDLLGRLHRLTPSVLSMADRLPPAERRRLVDDWNQRLRARRALVQALLAVAAPSPAARRRLKHDLKNGEHMLRRRGTGSRLPQ
jgi:hypothetical protein